MQSNKWPVTTDFEACIYNGKPAIYDKKARVYYSCKTMKAAKQRAIELNRGI